ncbi:hypothetical protein MVI01_71950 [Myxococcus virescens]|uniref:Uncharacterized protein n=1 Tax=Myxococcus virescens TaxID=83456 RepID=A0A511HP94_9BACT|nr:hypothetical protein MVI01_71950 [Myxococcus virescens]
MQQQPETPARNTRIGFTLEDTSSRQGPGACLALGFGPSLTGGGCAAARVSVRQFYKEWGSKLISAIYMER